MKVFCREKDVEIIRGIKIISEFLKTVKHGELKVDINDTSLNFSGKHVQGINHKGPIIKTDNWKNPN